MQRAFLGLLIAIWAIGATQAHAAACPNLNAHPGIATIYLQSDFGGELEELSPMEVSFTSGENASEVVPVSFETVVTETGMLQLWCVARDGRRWKLEFNVRERIAQ